MKVFELNDRRFNIGIELLREGRSFTFNDIDFYLDKDNRILEVRVETSRETKINEQTAMSDIQRGMSVFNYLKENSSVFAETVKAYSPRFSLISNDGMSAVEICYLFNEKIVWH